MDIRSKSTMCGKDGAAGSNGGKGGNGGAIYVQAGRIDLVNGIVSKCSASGRGSALYICKNVKFYVVPGEVEISVGDLKLLSGITVSSEDLQKHYNFLSYKVGDLNGTYTLSQPKIQTCRIHFIDCYDNNVKLNDEVIEKFGEEIAVPQKSGYVISNVSYDRGDGLEVDIKLDQNGKFKLDDNIVGGEVLSTNSDEDWKITLNVYYNKLYTIQYIYDNKIIGTKTDLTVKTELKNIINVDFTQIKLNSYQHLADAVDLGYKFLYFTCLKNDSEAVDFKTMPTKWTQLTKQAGGSTIILLLNYAPKEYTIKYLNQNNEPITVSDQQVKFGEDIKAVTPPKKVGYAFSHWQLEDSFGNLTDFNESKTTWDELAKIASSNYRYVFKDNPSHYFELEKMTEENWKEILNTKEVIKFKAFYEPKSYTIKYRYDTVTNISYSYETSYTSDDKGKSLSDEAKSIFSNTPVEGFDLKEWRYGAYCEHKYDVKNKPTWKDLVSSAVYDGKENVIFITAFYSPKT